MIVQNMNEYYIILYYVMLCYVILYYYIILHHIYGQDGGSVGKVDFNCAGPVMFACWYVGEVATWLTRLLYKTQDPKS